MTFRLLTNFHACSARCEEIKLDLSRMVKDGREARNLDDSCHKKILMVLDSIGALHCLGRLCKYENGQQNIRTLVSDEIRGPEFLSRSATYDKLLILATRR